jgi:hypothetical protein
LHGFSVFDALAILVRICFLSENARHSNTDWSEPMSQNHFNIRRWLIMCGLLIGAFMAALPSNAAEILPEDWLVAGPVWLPEKAFSDTVGSEAVKAVEIPLMDPEKLMPESGKSFDWYPGMTLTWTKESAEDGRLVLSTSEARKGQVYTAYAATYVESPRWQEISAKIESTQPYGLYVDGVFVNKATALTTRNLIELSAEQALHRGKHLILLVTSAVAESSSLRWEMKVMLESPDTLTISVDPRSGLTEFKDYALFDKVSQLVLSPDGGSRSQPSRQGFQVAFVDSGLQLAEPRLDSNHPDGIESERAVLFACRKTTRLSSERRRGAFDLEL